MKRDLRQVAEDLGLPHGPHDQDWGIQHADATRLAQFVADYGQHGANLDGWAAEYHLGELLLESANEVLLMGENQRADVEAAVSLIVARRVFEPSRVLLQYWTQLDDPEWVDGAETFPIASAVRHCLNEHDSFEDDVGRQYRTLTS